MAANVKSAQKNMCCDVFSSGAARCMNCDSQAFPDLHVEVYTGVIKVRDGHTREQIKQERPVDSSCTSLILFQ